MTAFIISGLICYLIMTRNEYRCSGESEEYTDIEEWD